MSSVFPVDFPTSVRSSSPSGLNGAVASYRRAQTFLVGSNITSHGAFPEHRRPSDDDIIVTHGHESPDEIGAVSATQVEVHTPPTHSAIDPLWDEEFQPSALSGTGTNARNNERTPLLTDGRVPCGELPTPETLSEHSRPEVHRNLPQRPFDSKYHHYGGNSTYRQTLFNSIAILLGIGMLSEPLAFAYSGWITGTILITFYGFITCYTAKILARIIAADPSLRTYADIGFKAFGRRSTVFTGLLFCLEIFTVSVVLLTLFGDSMHLVRPEFSSTQYKVFGLLIIIPTLFMPLSVLSYASILGILSTVLIIACIVVDGLLKHDTPGSLWQPAATDWVVKDAKKLGVAMGLFMAGFGGHAVMPSLARDMKDPSQFDQMINWAFGVATAIYAMIGGAGYLMFGKTVSEEISQDILATPGYNVFFNNLVMWMLVVATLSKYSLSTRPLNLTLEIWFGIEKPASPPNPSPPMLPPTNKSTAVLVTSRTITQPLMLVIERIALAVVAVSVSILIPEFSRVMAFLGSFSTAVLCVIWPVSAKVALYGRCSWYDGFLLAMSAVFAVWGTIAAF